jgi:GSH-dependent disulfide-bond oxidoreductase
MIDLYYWPTPNAHKITMFLEEVGLAYKISPVNIQTGEQFTTEFLSISPNNRMPAIVDHAPSDGGAPISVFESGAILEYLADKTGRFLPKTTRERFDVLQWTYWQMANVGPMFGQAFHFTKYAPEHIEYALTRYTKEVERLLGVLDDRLADREFICGDYSIADMATYPWIVVTERLDHPLDDCPFVQAWLARLKARPATTRAYDAAKVVPPPPPHTEAARKVLFNQGRIRRAP